MRGWRPLILWAAAMAALGVLPLVIGIGSIPDPVAIHWGLDGEPNNSWPIWAAALLPVGMVLIGLFTSSLFRIEGEPTAEAVAMVGLMGGVGVSIMASLVVLNWGADTWADAAEFGWVHLITVLAGGALFAGLGYALGIRWYPRPETPDSLSGPVLEVADDEKVSWIGGCTVLWPLFLVGGVGLVFLVMPGWWKLLSLLFMILAFLFLRVYVVVDDDGIEVRLGGGVRAKKIPLERIKTVQAIDLEPSQWAGWGYRVVPGGSAVVLRRGDAIQVNMVNDRKFAVTVDDAATGAALLSGLIDRRARQGA